MIVPNRQIMKPKLLMTYRLLVLALLLVSTQLTAQIAMKPPIPPGGTSAYTKICAGIDSGSGAFNSYEMTLSWAGAATADPDNVFILELSDANGDFTSPIELARVTDQNNNTSKSFNVTFSIPTNISGSAFKFRARSTKNSTQAISTASYPIYYVTEDTNLNISVLGDGVPPNNICSSGPVNLQVDNIANPESYQYQWYRGGTLLSETGPVLNVTTSGVYQALIDYGECTFNASTDSNYVTVTIGATGSGVAIASPSRTALCAGQTETLTVEIPNNAANYNWYKDDVIISGAVGTSYTIDASIVGFEGNYSVTKSGSGICTERSPAITITNAANFTVDSNNPATIAILPSKPQTLSVTTDASSPTYQWYRNGTTIGTNSNSLSVTTSGTYYCAVTASSGCAATINSQETVVMSPASFEIICDYDSTYTPCESTAITLEVNTINAINADGTKTDVTADLETSFNYQWQKNDTDITGATGQSINIDNAANNGDYHVIASIDGYTANSNGLQVQLLSTETITINSTSTIYCDSDDEITLSTTSDLTHHSFGWIKDGETINNTTPELTISQAGTYQLVVNKGGCLLRSNELVIADLDASLITFDVDGDLIFKEGTSKTVTASGGTAYEWYDENNNNLGNDNTITISEEGTYTLIANIDNCRVTKQLKAFYKDLFNVPNVITPNGDGVNDLWVIPNTYSNKADISVIIYNDQGLEMLNDASYQNNWPQSSLSFPQQNMIFYYIIKNPSEILKQGTITVIR